MTAHNGKPEEEPQPSSESIPEEIKSPSGKVPWSSFNPIINESDIKTVKDFRLVSKMLLGEINRLMEEVRQLKEQTGDYVQKTTELAVLKERLGAFNIRSLLYAVGGLLGGVAFLPDWSGKEEAGVLFLCFICFLVGLLDPEWLRNLFRRK